MKLLVKLYVLLICIILGISLPLCSINDDSYGTWVNSSEPAVKDIISQHFLCPQPNEASEFSQIWLPKDCAYHRFIKQSILSAAEYKILQRKKISSSNKLLILFVGDSALRGIFCGITRILSGSEINGPCENVICGTTHSFPISFTHTANKNGQKINNQPGHKKQRTNGENLLDSIKYVDFNDRLQFGFLYFQSFVSINHYHVEELFYRLIDLQPMSIIFSSGAWDFDHIARRNTSAVANPRCDSSELDHISKLRSSENIKNMFYTIGLYAKEHQVQMIYRNNHYNQRFGALCADEKLEEKVFKHLKVSTSLLPFNSAASTLLYTIFDNRRISQDIWREQTYDGFHFDRHRVHTVIHHQQLVSEFRNKQWILSGQLEMQLAQSLLNILFYDYLYEYGVKQLHKLNETLCNSAKPIT